jgi:hypothetical protein
MRILPLLAVSTAVVAVLGTIGLLRAMLGVARAEEGTVEFQEQRGSLWRSSGVLLIVAAVTAILVSGATWAAFPPLTPVMTGLGVFSIFWGGRIRVTPPPNPRVARADGPPPLPEFGPDSARLPDLGLALRPRRPRLPRRGRSH